MLSSFFRTTHVACLLPTISLRFSRQFSFPGKMRGGRISRLVQQPDRVGDPSSPVFSGPKGRYPHGGGQPLQENIGKIVPKHTKCLAASDPDFEKEYPPLSASNGPSSKTKRKTKIDLTNRLDGRAQEKPLNIGYLQPEALREGNIRNKDEESLLPTSFGKNRGPSPSKRHELRQTPPNYPVCAGVPDSAMGLPKLEPFDICFGRSRYGEQSLDCSKKVLRPGMVLLKRYITLSEQVQIVKKCRELGLGPGGFYQPSYRDGAKLRLQMMCLGKDWDPESRKYRKQRAVDGAEVPIIPSEFKLIVKRAIRDSHVLIQETIGVSNVEDELPDICPDICIVNFYNISGRLGLHQDRDESEEILRKGLPVVSFSIGNSAEFLYGDQRDVDKAEKVLLESGDVLIFGGKSRHIFHGVASIIHKSAPRALLEETNLRPGRLNLTFRQY